MVDKTRNIYPYNCWNASCGSPAYKGAVPVVTGVSVLSCLLCEALCLCLTPSVLVERGLLTGVVPGDPSIDGGVVLPSGELFSACEHTKCTVWVVWLSSYYIKRKHTVQNIQMFNLINKGTIRDFTHIDAFKFSHNFKKYPPFLKHLWELNGHEEVFRNKWVSDDLVSETEFQKIK